VTGLARRDSGRGPGRGILARAAGFLVVVIGLVACASSSTPPARPSTVVPITDYKMVAGKWGGLVTGLSGPRGDQGDWVEMTIAENGAYDFGVARTIGMFHGKGTFALKEGKLAMEGERGHATFTLLQGEGVKVLRANGMLRSGTALSGDLRPAR
jgi:hypothetical protein